MKRLTVHALYLLLLTATTGQVTARYDCRVTGVTNQSSCCCEDEAKSVGAQCGCCDIRYQDGTPEVAKAKPPTAQGDGILVVGLVSDASIVLSDPSSGPTDSTDDPDPPSKGPGRHIFFCSFLC